MKMSVVYKTSQTTPKMQETLGGVWDATSRNAANYHW